MSDAQPLEPVSPTRAYFWIAVRALLAFAGLGVVIYLVLEIGMESVSNVLLPALPYLPIAVALELARIGMDALSSRLTLGRRGHVVPFWPLLASHLVAYAVMGVAPAGRATSEAMKSTLLARWIGAPTAIALGTANQANTFLSSGTFTIASTAAVYALTGFSDLTKACLAHSILLNIFGLAMRIAARYPKLERLFNERFPRLRSGTATFVETSRETAIYPLGPVGAMMIGRALQVGQFAVLLAAVGATVSVVYAFALHGLFLVIAALGVLIPGQLGANEGGFVSAHALLDMDRTHALAVALLAHGVQLSLVIVGFIVLALWPAAPTEGSASSGDEVKEPASDDTNEPRPAGSHRVE